MQSPAAGNGRCLGEAELLKTSLHLASDDIFPLDAAQQQADIVPSLTLIQLFFEHFHTYSSPPGQMMEQMI